MNEEKKLYLDSPLDKLEGRTVGICPCCEQELPYGHPDIEIAGEPKPDEVTYTLTCDNCGKAFYSLEAFPSSQICPKCSKPDEWFTEERIKSAIERDEVYKKYNKEHPLEPDDRLLTPREKDIAWKAACGDNTDLVKLSYPDVLLKAQDAQTAPIIRKEKDAECSKKIEEIFREMEEWMIPFDHKSIMAFTMDDYEALKDRIKKEKK